MVGYRLAMIGSVKDEILNMTDLAYALAAFLREDYPGSLSKRFGEELEESAKEIQILEQIAVLRGCLKKGGEPDAERACLLLLDDFRSGRLGRITLEKAAEPVEKENAERSNLI